jgi:hypothetical protein
VRLTGYEEVANGSGSFARYSPEPAQSEGGDDEPDETVELASLALPVHPNIQVCKS